MPVSLQTSLSVILCAGIIHAEERIMPTRAKSSIARDLSQVPPIPKALIRQFVTGSR